EWMAMSREVRPKLLLLNFGEGQGTYRTVEVRPSVSDWLGRARPEAARVLTKPRYMFMFRPASSLSSLDGRRKRARHMKHQRAIPRARQHSKPARHFCCSGSATYRNCSAPANRSCLSDIS